MDSVVVTLRHKQNEVDLELPVSVPFFVLTPILIDKLSWKDLASDREDSQFTGRVISSGVVIRPNETLGQAGVVDGDILELVVTASGPAPGDLPPVRNKGAYLQCAATGQIFPCRGRATLVGRSPHLPINLASLPNSDAASRKHANIVCRNDGYWIKDERSTNGTIVDGYPLESGKSVRIRDSSHIQFGEEGPVLIFRAGEPGL